MLSPKRNGNRRRIACARNAPRRSATQVHHTDARNVASGMLPATLQPSIKIRGGVCIGYACPVMPSKNVSFAPKSKRRSISESRLGEQTSRHEESACNVKQNLVVLGNALLVTNDSRSCNFLTSWPSGRRGKMARRYATPVKLRLRRPLSANGR